MTGSTTVSRVIIQTSNVVPCRRRDMPRTNVVYSTTTSSGSYCCLRRIKVSQKSDTLNVKQQRGSGVCGALRLGVSHQEQQHQTTVVPSVSEKARLLLEDAMDKDVMLYSKILPQTGSTTTNMECRVSRSGEVSLWSVDTGLVSKAHVVLPRVCQNVVPRVDSDGEVVVVSWGNGCGAGDHDHEVGSAAGAGGWVARLRLTMTSSSSGIEKVPMVDMEYSVDWDRVETHHATHTEGAEISIALEPSGHWFGGGHFIRQMWPLNDASLEVGPWYAFDNGPNGVNTLLGAHWVTSRGLLVSVDPSAPYLHIGMNAPNKSKKETSWKASIPQRKWGVGIQNATRELLPLTKGHGRVARAGQDGLLRIQSRRNYVDAGMEHPLKHWVFGDSSNNNGDGESLDSKSNATTNVSTVRVSMRVAGSAAEACRVALGSMTPPKQMPDVSLFKDPIWTTWARYKTHVSQEKVLAYAREICDRGLPRSVMEIDDRWQVAYGDVTFDRKKFPDPVGMVNQLHDMGFKVTTWVHPFVERQSEAYVEGAAKGYFVGCDMADHPLEHGPLGWILQAKHRHDHAMCTVDQRGPGGSKIGFFKWWNTPPVAALDVTNPDAVDWFVARLKKLQADTGVDGFKFDAGEPCFLPRMPRTHRPLSTPAEYTQLYVQQVAGQFAGGVSEVRTGHSTQDVALMYRMGDRFSTWDAANGLRSLIPTLLTSGVLGYPFCLPDMIGGNAYFNTFPDKELLVRWAQVNALMPAMQFSLAPWDLGRDTELLVAKAIAVRKKLEDYLVMLAEEAAESLMPICRPLWMIAPEEEDTYQIQDQFALGNDIIVAPVVCRGARRRDVYLTEGRWRDIMDGSLIDGGRWLKNVASPLDHLPVYIRDNSGIRW